MNTVQRHSWIVAALAGGLLMACSSDVQTATVAWPEDFSGNLLIRDVAVVDVETGTRTLARDVLVREGRIEAIEAAGSIPSEGIRTIEG
jgi:hypothetical protein